MDNRELAQNLYFKGYHIVDNFLPQSECELIRDEIATLYSKGKLIPEIATETNELGETVIVDERPFYALRLFNENDTEIKNITPQCRKFLSEIPKRICTQVNDALHADVRPKGYKPYCTIDKQCKEIGMTSHVDTDGDYDFNKLACSTVPNAHLPKHLDNNGLDPDDLRKLTCILYLNEDWDSSVYGGQLRLHNFDKFFAMRNSGSEQKQDEPMYIDVDPIINRLVMFWSDLIVHEVLPTTAERPRYTLTVWIPTKDAMHIHSDSYLVNKILRAHFSRE
jgi:hypothetical protein